MPISPGVGVCPCLCLRVNVSMCVCVCRCVCLSVRKNLVKFLYACNMLLNHQQLTCKGWLWLQSHKHTGAHSLSLICLEQYGSIALDLSEVVSLSLDPVAGSSVHCSISLGYLIHTTKQGSATPSHIWSIMSQAKHESAYLPCCNSYVLNASQHNIIQLNRADNHICFTVKLVDRQFLSIHGLLSVTQQG